MNKGKEIINELQKTNKLLEKFESKFETIILILTKINLKKIKGEKKNGI